MRWLTEKIGTAAHSEVLSSGLSEDVALVDVRDLVDKAGNSREIVLSKIDLAVRHLKEGRRVMIACDHGMSRSNAIAVGVIAKSEGVVFREAMARLKGKVDESGIKIEVLDIVRRVVAGTDTPIQPQRRFMLTGGSGFVGQALKSRIPCVAPSRSEVDLLRNATDMDGLVHDEHITDVIHLASPRVYTTTQSMGDALVMLKNVLDVCRVNGLHLTYISGWEIYSGYRTTELVADHRLPPNPRGTYGETKWLCESLVRNYECTYGISYSILRISPIYGPQCGRPRFIYNFIEKAVRNAPIQTHRYQNGSPRLDLIHISDAVEAIRLATETGFRGELNVGSGRTTSTLEVAQMICQITGSQSSISQVEVAGDAPNVRMDIQPARRILGWSPTVALSEGLAGVCQPYLLD